MNPTKNELNRIKSELFKTWDNEDIKSNGWKFNIKGRSVSTFKVEASIDCDDTGVNVEDATITSIDKSGHTLYIDAIIKY